MIKIIFETTFLAVVFTICLAYKLKNFLPGDVTSCRRTDPLTLFTFTGITNLLSSNIEKNCFLRRNQNNQVGALINFYLGICKGLV